MRVVAVLLPKDNFSAVLMVGDAGGGVHVELHGVARRQLQQDALTDHGLALDGGLREFNKPQ